MCLRGLSTSPKLSLSTTIPDDSEQKITRCRSTRGHVRLYWAIYERFIQWNLELFTLRFWSCSSVNTTSYLLHQTINMYRTTAGKAAEADELKTKPVRLAVRGRGMPYSSPPPRTPFNTNHQESQSSTSQQRPTPSPQTAAKTSTTAWQPNQESPSTVYESQKTVMASTFPTSRT